MFKPIKTPKVYDQVIEQIKNKIKSGEIKKGDKLPSEREMAESLSLSYICERSIKSTRGSRSGGK